MNKKSSQGLSLSELLTKLLSSLESEISSLPETLKGVSPEKRLDFISKTLPLLVKCRDSWDTSWSTSWGD
jgi:hypothetical protein